MLYLVVPSFEIFDSQLIPFPDEYFYVVHARGVHTGVSIHSFIIFCLHFRFHFFCCCFWFFFPFLFLISYSSLSIFFAFRIKLPRRFRFRIITHHTHPHPHTHTYTHIHTYTYHRLARMIMNAILTSTQTLSIRCETIRSFLKRSLGCFGLVE